MEQNFSLKRIFRDVKELQLNKLIGISACIPDETNIMRISANVQIQEGIYRGLLVPITLILPQRYPLSPPAAYVVPGHPFDHRFHEHILQKFSMTQENEGASICTDLTSNFAGFFNQEQGSGWTPAYTIQSVLIQLQTFFAKPDLPKSCMPSLTEIRTMIEASKKFTHKIKCVEGGKSTFIQSSLTKPFPFLDTQEFQKDDQKEEKTTTTKQKQKDQEEGKDEAEMTPDEKKYIEERNLKFEIANKLVCPITKKEVYEQEPTKYGYPMMVTVDKFGRLQVAPVIEIISSEGVVHMKGNSSIGKSIYGFEFNQWVPIYVNEKHFSSVKDELINLMKSVLNVKVFKPIDILKFFPPILVKTAIQFLKGELHQSYAAIDAYCQFQYLLVKLMQIYPEVKEEIDDQVNRFMKDKANRHKREAGDLGEFMIKASLSKWGFFHAKIKLAIFREFLTRQVSWIMKDNVKFQNHMEKTNDLVNVFFSEGAVAKQFYLLQNETTKLLVNDTVLKEQEARFGFIPDSMIRTFRKNLLEGQTKANNGWKVFVESLDLLDQLPDENKMHDFLVEAILDAKDKYAEDINQVLTGRRTTNNNGTNNFQRNQNSSWRNK